MQTQNTAQQKFIRRISNPFLFKLFILKKLPLAFFAGLRIEFLNTEKCIVSVPYKWLSQNPFKSIYFAAQSMAAEMSSGILMLSVTQGYHPTISILVKNVAGTFTKKASERIYFTCITDASFYQKIEHALKNHVADEITFESIGTFKDQTIVSNFSITWSFKQKSK